MAANDLFAGVADWLLWEAVGYYLAAPLPSAPPLLRRGTHGGCDWFTGFCSVPDRETWLATGTDRTASCRRSRCRRHRGSGRCHGRGCHRPEAPLTAALRVLGVHGPTPLRARPR